MLPEHRTPEGPVSVYYLADILSDELSADELIVSGSSGSAIELFLLALRVRDGQRVFHTTALGAMGFGIAAAIGACIGSGRRRTICVDGDGGFQFNIQETDCTTTAIAGNVLRAQQRMGTLRSEPLRLRFSASRGSGVTRGRGSRCRTSLVSPTHFAFRRMSLPVNPTCGGKSGECSAAGTAGV